MPIHAYAAKTPKSMLVPYEYDLPGIGPGEVDIAITHCGICHSDIHLIDNDWAISKYPLVPGHEIVGTVGQAGRQVHHLKTGDRVGIGWQAGACFRCEWCNKGEENFCDKSIATCVTRPGGYAESVRVDARFAFRIPENISSENAAPLLCGGITVYSPFRQYDIKPAMKVGVVGIGGLGHLALQYAHAWGCEVTAFSGSPNKEAEAKKLGAHHFVDTSKSRFEKGLAGTQDIILSAVSADIDWLVYMNLLRPRGKIIVVGASPSPLSIPAGMLIHGQRSVCGSVIGSRWLIEEMLEFSARHQIQAQVETMPIAEVNTAIQRLRDNKARYRMVLVR